MSERVDAIQAGQYVMTSERDAVEAARRNLDWKVFEEMVDYIGESDTYKVVVTGVGKSAIAARKIAATLATVGVQAVFLDPVGMFHGELGLLRVEDLVLMVSQSGETEELVRLLEPLRRRGVVVISIVGEKNSTLGRLPRGALCTGVTEEPYVRVPTASSAAAVAVGDALALAVAMRTGFDESMLERTHPGGAIGRRINKAFAKGLWNAAKAASLNH
jgi:arabinose-5-phosphate isomerase